MTHRSRSGGPTRTKAGQKKKAGKLHHPPSRDAPAAGPESEAGSESESESKPAAAAVIEEEDAVLPASAFRTPDDLDLLNILRWALHACVHSVDFTADVQKVKALLYERKWLELFTDPALLDAYAGRWVPSRALAFRQMMAEIRGVRGLFCGAVDEAAEGKETPAPKHILAIGGGAGSELLAVAALSASRAPIHWTGVDIGDWSSVLTRIEAAARDKWAISPRARFDFIETDVLASTAFMEPLPAPDLTTIFFTLTELLSQNRAGTLALLRKITDKAQPGSLLLVADSASDIAEFPLGKDGRTWPVYMVLDALVGVLKGWEKVRASDSTWFRLDEEVVAGARWPCKLENARYWMRLYRRV
jgi:25S rRNA (uracil2843-N3)-methyltransferase